MRIPLLRAGMGLVAALALAAAARAADWSQAESVTVVAADYRFEPSDLSFRAGVPYRLRVENHGKENHELTAAAFFKAVELGNPEVLNADRTELFVQPGEQKEVRFVARQAGRYPFACADHDWAGMTGLITVR